MINGRFVVFGSPNYLKTSYGQGYTIEILQDRQKLGESEHDVRKLVSERIPAAELLFDGSMSQNLTESASTVQFRYRIEGINSEQPIGRRVMLSEAFGVLAGLLQSETIKDFSLTRTNLEQVFINFAKF